jgi:hypothetical protein
MLRAPLRTEGPSGQERGVGILRSFLMVHPQKEVEEASPYERIEILSILDVNENQNRFEFAFLSDFHQVAVMGSALAAICT